MPQRTRIILLLAAVFIIALVAGWSLSARAAASPPVKRSSSALALTADGAFLLAVNPDSNTLTLVNTAARTVLAEIPVGIDPRTTAVDDAGRFAYTANRGSGTVTVIDLQTRTPLLEIPVGFQPYGVLTSPGGDFIFISLLGEDRLLALRTHTWETVLDLPLPDRPAGLALTPDSHTLLVTHLLTGQVTLVDLRLNRLYLPILSQRVGFLGVRLFAPPSNLSSDQLTLALYPSSNLAQSVVLSPDGAAAYLPHTRSNTGNHALAFDTTVFPLVSVLDLPTRTHQPAQMLALGTLDPPGVGLPFDAALTPDGAHLWVLNAASNDITVIDLDARAKLAHIEVGDNPRGLILSSDGQTAYVNNTLAGTLSVIDTGSYSVTAEIPLTEIPLPPLLLEGKRLFNSSDDPRLSQSQWIACSSCHFDGEHDGRTWFFNFAGPRNTTSLLGMVQTYPLRWSGEWDESADSELAIQRENFGVGFLGGGMNCAVFPPDCVHQPPNQGQHADLDALAAYLDFLSLPPSPWGDADPAAVQRGASIFQQAGCAECHPAPLYTDHLSHDVGTATAEEKIGPEYDTPTLNGLHSSAPYFHDGSALTLADAVTFPSPGGEHHLSQGFTPAQIADLEAFLLALPLEEYP